MSENNFTEGFAVGQGMNNGYGGGWGSDWIALIVLAALFGGGGFGWGGGGGANVFGEVQRGFDTTGINNKLNGLENGLCDGFYAQNTNLLNGFAGVSREIADRYPERKLIIRVEGHLTCALYGVVTDIWDCSEELVDRYWVV